MSLTHALPDADKRSRARVRLLPAGEAGFRVPGRALRYRERDLASDGRDRDDQGGVEAE